VKEFKKRIMFYGEKEAIEDISELTSRLKNLKKQYNFYYSSNAEELEKFEIPSETDVSDDDDDEYDDDDDDGDVLIEDDNDDSYEIDEESDRKYSSLELKEMSNGVIPKRLIKKLNTQKKRFLEKNLESIYDGDEEQEE
jgi:hypothetical protein